MKSAEEIQQLETDFENQLKETKNASLIMSYALLKEALTSFMETTSIALEKVTQSKWISVKDRLPETANKRYIATDGEIVSVVRYMGGNKWEVNIFDDLIDRQLTHWQPLPLPPEP